MIRFALIWVAMATSAFCQTPVDISVANDLRACIADELGSRDATRVGHLNASLAQVPNRRWPNVTEIAPGIHRITGTTPDISIEIKLRDPGGNAHCLAFGSKITPGQGALIADKFVELNFLPGLQQAAPGPGMTRRYTVFGAPYQADLIAFPSGNGGDIVGFSFIGLPMNLTTRRLSSDRNTNDPQTARLAISNAVTICLRNYFAQDSVNTALEQSGFEFGFSTGSSSPARVFFTRDNGVSLQIKPGTCIISTRQLGPAGTAQVLYNALNANAPGGFEARSETNGCTTFFTTQHLNVPMFINVTNEQGQGARNNCIEDGTSRIAFGVAG